MSGATEASSYPRYQIVIAVLVAALGYFVDVYDLLLFSIVRVVSLTELGVAEADLLARGVYILNMQMCGLLLGGILWGIWGDKKGRITVLFGSILLYSVANLLNAYVVSIEQYGWLRLIAGIGLAGELGAGITLVCELLPKESRGYATTIVATVGVLGAVAAAMVGEIFPWRTAYLIGGILGLLLLILRISVSESGLFKSLAKTEVRRGDLRVLFSSRERMVRYLASIAIGLPVWFVVGILMTFSPELGRAQNMFIVPKAGQAIFYCYIGLSFGDLASGLLSQFLRSRRKSILFFVLLTFAATVSFLRSAELSMFEFQLFCLLLGFGAGFWAVFVTAAAEQFGTNLRATVATTVPNFVRGSVVPLTILFKWLTPSVGIITSAMLCGMLTTSLALLALYRLRETFGRDLDFLEH